MNKIVYLMGAGASRGIRVSDNPQKYPYYSYSIVEGLPVVNELYMELNSIYNELTNTTPISNKQYNTIDNHSYSSGEAKDLFLKAWSWLSEETRRHATIDTLAKKLYLTGKRDEFQKVKSLLSIFFVIEQSLRKMDSRYDTFLANILNNKLEIPDNIRILTWNYDRQFEFAYREYTDNKFLSAFNSSKLGVYDFIGNEIQNRNCRIYKLNGTADFKVPLQYDLIEEKSFDANVLDKTLEKFIGSMYYKPTIFANNSRLFFAWENNNYNTEFFNKVNQDIKEATTLVVIGYTFPFFNRETDRFILGCMPNLQRIYIQDPNAENLKQNIVPVLSPEQALSNLDKRVITITNCDQFFLPPEL